MWTYSCMFSVTISLQFGLLQIDWLKQGSCWHFWMFSCSLIHKEWWMSGTSGLNAQLKPNIYNKYCIAKRQNTKMTIIPQMQSLWGVFLESSLAEHLGELFKYISLYIQKDNSVFVVISCLNLQFTSGSAHQGNPRILFRFAWVMRDKHVYNTSIKCCC